MSLKDQFINFKRFKVGKVAQKVHVGFRALPGNGGICESIRPTGRSATAGKEVVALRLSPLFRLLMLALKDF